MIMLQTMIMPQPVIIPVSSGPSGPWTHNDTRILICIVVATILWWFFANVLEVFNKKNSGKTPLQRVWNGMRMCGDLDCDCFMFTEVTNIFCYPILGLAALGGLVYFIYTLIP